MREQSDEEAHTEYRLTFELIDPFVAADMEGRHGRGVWLSLSDFEWDRLPWRAPIVKITTDPWAQHQTLVRWAESHEQPIRNVGLERREVPHPDAGWSPVEHGPSTGSENR